MATPFQQLTSEGEVSTSIVNEVDAEKVPVLVCRLCAIILATEEKSGCESSSDMKWVHLMKICGHSSYTVQEVVTKYLPKVILGNAAERCPVVCLGCYKSLTELMTFIGKIMRGQAKLEKLSLPGKDFDIPAPRRRGRPRKNNQVQSVAEKVEKDVILEELRRTTRRGSRISDAGTSLLNFDSEISGISNTPHSEDKTEDGELGKSIDKDVSINSNSAKPDSDIESNGDMSEKGDPAFVNVKKRKRGRPRKKLQKRVDFKCEVCGKIYFHYSSLTYHKLAAHSDKDKLKCSICEKSFNHKALLANHMFTHNAAEGSLTCDVPNCNSRSSLCKHKRSGHSTVPEKEFTCEKCGMQFTTNSSLKAHDRLHTGEKPFACDLCDKRFNHKGNLKEHIRTHTGEKLHECLESNCGKRFATLSKLKAHKLTHLETKSFLCVQCGKSFNTLASMNLHAKRHKGEVFGECHVCNKKFLDPWSLRKHTRTHTGERPYECKICKKTFSDPSNFMRHKKIHPPPKSFSHPDAFEKKQSKTIVETVKTPLSTPELDNVVESVEIEVDQEINLSENQEHPGVVLASQSLVEVEIIAPEAFATLNTTDANVIYHLYDTDIRSVTNVHEVTSEINQSMDLHSSVPQEEFRIDSVTTGDKELSPD